MLLVASYHNWYLLNGCICLQIICMVMGSSEWNNWSPCSRTCGIGIMEQSRLCSTPDCQAHKQYKSCYIQDCSNSSPDFRAAQCSRLNKNGVYWTPLTGNEAYEGCHLHCKSNISSDKIVVPARSGTSCSTASVEKGTCLDTTCVPTGCDGIVGSLKKFGKCLRCLNEVNCRNFFEVINTTEYVSRIVPVNATFITINFTSPIFLSNTESRNLSRAQEFIIGGLTFVPYSPDCIFARGPLVHPLSVQVHGVTSLEYYHIEQENFGGTQVPEVNHTSVFYWSYSAFSQCSVSCAEGLEATHAHCRDPEFPDRILPDSFCHTVSKPLPIVRKCYRGVCPARWVTGEWGACSRTCGVGHQARTVICKQVQENGSDRSDVNGTLCEQVHKPNHTRACNRNICDAKWRVRSWSKCSIDCGTGIWTRKVECVNSDDVILDSHNCDPIVKPISSQPCYEGPCYYTWHSFKWNSCSTTCGTGTKQRTIQCRTHTKRNVSADHCHTQLLPINETTCTDFTGCQTSWLMSRWSTCQGGCCEVNTQHRTAVCIATVGAVLKKVNDSFCLNITKPATKRICTRADCPLWREGTWSSCSVTCGGGKRMRNVECTLGSLQQSSCCENIKPSEISDCNEQDCNRNCTNEINSCSSLEKELCTSKATDFYRKICCKYCKQFQT